MKKINYTEAFVKAMKKTNQFGNMCENARIDTLKRLFSKKDQWNEFIQNDGTLKEELKNLAYNMEQVGENELCDMMYKCIHLVEEIEEATREEKVI